MTLPPTSRTNIWVERRGVPRAGQGAGGVRRVGRDRGHQRPADHRRARDVSRHARRAVRRRATRAPASRRRRRSGSWPRARPGPFFDLFVLIANPGDDGRAGRGHVICLPDGTVITKPYTVARQQPLQHLGAISTRRARSPTPPCPRRIRSLNGVPIIVERAMWWPGDRRPGTRRTTRPGATTTGTKWALAEGEVGGAARRRDLHPDRQHVAARRHRQGDAALRGRHQRRAATFTVTANSRFNVDARSRVPERDEQAVRRDRREPRARRPRRSSSSARCTGTLGRQELGGGHQRARHEAPSPVISLRVPRAIHLLLFCRHGPPA